MKAMARCLLLCLAGLGPPALRAAVDTGEPDLAAAVRRTREDIDSAAAELTELREHIAEERQPLAARIVDLQAEVRELRRKAERSRALRRQREQEYDALKADTRALREEQEFIRAVLTEYRRSLPTRMGAAEVTLLEPRLEKVDSVMHGDEGAEALPGLTAELFGLAARWNTARFGGHVFAGTALDSEGIEQPGRFAVLGPVTLFSGDQGELAGLATARAGSILPFVAGRFEAPTRARIAKVMQGTEQRVPVDVTSGDALKVAGARLSLWEHARRGGFVMLPLVALGILAVILVAWKLLELSRINIAPDIPVEDMAARMRRGDIEGARGMAARLGPPVDDLVLTAMQHRNAPREHLEEILHEHVLAYVPRLERHLGALAVFGGVAPLLGLLGTVTGMIHTFQLVTIFGTGDARLLSGGISEALITTEFGLVIAIPVLLIHAFLSRRVRTVIAGLEDAAAHMVYVLKLKEDAG